MSASQSTKPQVEEHLVAAHHDLRSLRERRESLLRSGIHADHLPDELVLMSFALLGDHDREILLERLSEHWALLQAKGLVYGPVEAASTAELRLIDHARPHTDAIGSVWDQLNNAEDAPPPPQETWRSAKRVRGLWGQPARLHFTMEHIRHLLIDPDPVFGLQQRLIAANPESRHRGFVEFPIDEGSIRISLLDSRGEVFRYLVDVFTEEAA